LNPLEFMRAELVSPLPAEQALAALDQLLADGIEAEDRLYRLFGSRHGRYFSMSLGMPLLGGSQPVLRAWLAEESGPSMAGPSRFDVSVGARIEGIVASVCAALLIILGGGYQLFLQSKAVAEGRATIGQVAEVLPGIGIIAGLVALAMWIARRRAMIDAVALLDVFRDAIGAPEVDDSAESRPLH